MNLKRPKYTHWNYHYSPVISLILKFSSIIDAVVDIVEDDLYYE